MGIFSYTPLREGKGVNPDDPKLRGPFRFFYVYGVNFFKILKLNLLYILFCLPVVTIGPATAAMVYVLKCHINEEHVFLFYDFFRTFKENFIKSLGFSLIQAAALFSLWLSYINLGSIPGMNSLLFPLFLANLLIIITGFYFYPLTVTYDLKFQALNFNIISHCIYPPFFSNCLLKLIANISIYALALLSLFSFRISSLGLLFSPVREIGSER